jgi:hypothetical protein
MMKRIYILPVIVLLCSCNSPDAWDILKPVGHTKTVSRELNDFKEIRILENVEFKIVVQDTASRAIVSAGKNILPKIKTDVYNGTLTVKDKNGYDFVRSSSRVTRMEIYTKQLNKLETSTGRNFYILSSHISDSLSILLPQCSGDMSASISTKKLSLILRESTSKVEIVGRADTLYYNAGQSFGPILLSQLEVKKGTIVQSGSNNLEIYVTDSLNVSISGMGNVYYRGNPLIKSKITGKGKLIKM